MMPLTFWVIVCASSCELQGQSIWVSFWRWRFSIIVRWLIFDFNFKFFRRSEFCCGRYVWEITTIRVLLVVLSSNLLLAFSSECSCVLSTFNIVYIDFQNAHPVIQSVEAAGKCKRYWRSNVVKAVSCLFCNYLNPHRILFLLDLQFNDIDFGNFNLFGLSIDGLGGRYLLFLKLHAWNFVMVCLEMVSGLKLSSFNWCGPHFQSWMNFSFKVVWSREQRYLWHSLFSLVLLLNFSRLLSNWYHLLLLSRSCLLCWC